MSVRGYGVGNYGYGTYGVALGYNLFQPSAVKLFHDIWNDPNLVGFWPMNEGTSSLYDRALAYRNNATAVGPTYGATVRGLPAMAFTQSASHYVSIGDVPALNFERTSPFTLIVAAQHNTVNTEQTYISKADARGWWWSMNASGKQIVVMYSTVPNYQWVEANVALTSATPYLQGFTNSGATNAAGMKLWTNGSTVAQTTVLNTLSQTVTSTAPAAIGTYLSTGYMNGNLGFAAAFNVAKTGEDMKRWARLGGFI